MGRSLAALLVLSALPVSADDFDPGRLLRRARAADDVPAVQGGELTPSGVPDAGHNAASHPSQYNIWANNCHTAANSFAANASAAGQTGGVLACQGNPETDPAYHTANWALDGAGRTCIYNWGKPCCWEGESTSPDLSGGMAKQCAQWACGAQYDAAQTRALPPNQLVESPSAQACAVQAAGGPPTLLPAMAVSALSERVRTGADTVKVPAYPHHPEGATLTFSAERLEPCLRCCGDRAAMWSGNAAASVNPALANGREDLFKRQCATACRSSFKAP